MPLTLPQLDWVSTFINAPVVAKQVEQITAGVTRPKVTLRDVRNLLIATPSTEEQQRVLDRVAAMESRIQLEISEFQKFVAKKVWPDGRPPHRPRPRHVLSGRKRPMTDRPVPLTTPPGGYAIWLGTLNVSNSLLDKWKHEGAYE